MGGIVEAVVWTCVVAASVVVSETVVPAAVDVVSFAVVLIPTVVDAFIDVRYVDEIKIHKIRVPTRNMFPFAAMM